MIIYKTFLKTFLFLSLRLGMLVWRGLGVLHRVLQSDHPQEAETTDEGVELKIEGKDPKCRKILSNVSFAMRSSF